MIKFTLNSVPTVFKGDPNRNLLDFLRNDKHITSVKDGCSGQATCGACTVEIDGKAKLACVTKMSQLHDTNIITMEGFPEYVRDTIVKTFVNHGAVQCGFCIPGIISRTKVLLQNNPNPTLAEIQQALKPHICRCTGYKKIEESILSAAEALKAKSIIELTLTNAKIGVRHPKYGAYETALGERKFTEDYYMKGMLFGALKFSDHPKAVVKKIDISKAVAFTGVKKVFTANDIPGDHLIGLILKDQSVMIAEGETTHFIGDVIAGVVAETEAIAREAVKLIEIEYDVLNPVTDVFEAIKGNPVHAGKPNNFNTTCFRVGNADEAFQNAVYIAKGHFETQRIEHGFLEKESAVAYPDKEDGIEVLSQGQGVYVDQKQIAAILNLPEEKVRVTLVPNGGGFGGKEDLTVQGYAAMFAYLLKTPVKVSLTRPESLKMHPKRHPVFMDMELAADKEGNMIGLRLKAVGDTGAYASVGMKVLERVAGHATAGYFVPHVDIEAKTVYTNNVPCGAMRGFGANQVSFAIENCIDDICYQAGFDRWEFRYKNALRDGLATSTGQKVYGVGIQACMEAVKEDFYAAKYAGIACAIKNSGVGNGMVDESKVIIDIISPKNVVVRHGWTEMGQGVHSMALQTLCEETGIDPQIVTVEVDTNANIETGMTTSSRGTALLGLAIINACKSLKDDLAQNSIDKLAGKSYFGQYICDWTTKPGNPDVEQKTHYSYGYAVQLCILDDEGNIKKIVAAHDAGKIMNPMLFEGQIEGGVAMGLGYALSEDLPMKDGFLVSDKMRDLQLLRAHEIPEIVVKGIEVTDPVGPYGAKGIGEIGLVPTAAAVACAFYNFDGIQRKKLPMKRK
ncbi:MAG: molybdopterin-dependent oxidoreductase [Salinivirgaceae bacterium]|nr:molybdopterin-dependent oxidoreductase [Salinivirgaceae bacterium]